ncbi:MAG TPA: ATPase domain-containing protein [Candidatus Competibacteraceae bacterium]|nr:ATPase domain-containing protein [Candidatus Competibacteraceae bacterium]
MTDAPAQDSSTLLRTGIQGLDEVLCGGLVPNRLYLIEGNPGAGKTTLALQFLLAGARLGEQCLFVALSESEEELRDSVQSHGWTLDGLHILEIIASEEALNPDARYTMYHSSEVELIETTKAMLAEAERIQPTRLVFDSLSELRLLAENPLRYRRQILALKQHFSRQQCTVLFVDDRAGEARDMHLHSLAHGVLSLECETPEYGTMRRRLQVNKLRGRAFREGYHDVVIRHGGIEVFPRLVATEHPKTYARQTISSGLEALDTLLGGGLAKGTSTLILGAAGTGKSSLATQYAWTEAVRGEHAALFLFDETMATHLERSAGLGMDLVPLIETGRLSMRQVDPAELSPGEFAHNLRQVVDQNQTRLVVIDSLNGYLNAMPSERFLMLHLHELLTYLGQQGVTTLLLMAQHGLIGSSMQVPVDASYLTDTVLLLRYFEAFGKIRQGISVIKKRTGKHERTIRELYFNQGITVGEPLQDFQGVLTGSPQFVGHGLNGANRSDERPANT